MMAVPHMAQIPFLYAQPIHSHVCTYKGGNSVYIDLLTLAVMCSTLVHKLLANPALFKLCVGSEPVQYQTL